MERVVDVVRRALIAQWEVVLFADPLAQGCENAGFADAGLSRQHGDLAFRLGRTMPAFDQEGDLRVSADERRQRL